MQVGAFLLQSQKLYTKSIRIKMITWLIDLFLWIKRIWDNLPESVKKEFVEIMAERFEDALRAFYKQEQNNRNGESNV